jgi:hypothetical protein
MAKQAVSRTRSSSSSRKPRIALFEPARAPMMTATPMPTHEAIAQRAFELYLARGEAGGDEMSDWLRAETELRAVQL